MTVSTNGGENDATTATAPSAGRERMLVVVAHPDDETFGCGSLLLHAAAAGVTTAVLCATRGEAGEAADGTPAAELGAVREAETRAAAELLGVSQVEFLDFQDSGMTGDADPATLVGADPDDVRDQVRARVEAFRPTMVVTLDGSDGHRDHARIRDTTLAAVDVADWQADRVYLHCLPQALMRRWVDHLAEHDPSWEHLRSEVPGTPQGDITTTIDTAAHLTAREHAMRLHRSQRSPYDGLPEPLRREFLVTESLRRVRPAWTGGAQETDVPRPPQTTGRPEPRLTVGVQPRQERRRRRQGPVKVVSGCPPAA